MYSENTVVMRGEWPRIWQLSSELEKWVERLPHYRKIVIDEVSEDGLTKKAYMSAWRDFIPCSWRTIQRLKPSDDPAEARIFWNHIGGVTKGMEVVWLFEPLGDNAYKVTITHDWKPKWPLVGGLASHLIGELIVKNVAGKTLNRFRQLAAQGEAATAGNREQGIGMR